MTKKCKATIKIENFQLEFWMYCSWKNKASMPTWFALLAVPRLDITLTRFSNKFQADSKPRKENYISKILLIFCEIAAEQIIQPFLHESIMHVFAIVHQKKVEKKVFNSKADIFFFLKLTMLRRDRCKQLGPLHTIMTRRTTVGWPEANWLETRCRPLLT